LATQTSIELRLGTLEVLLPLEMVLLVLVLMPMVLVRTEETPTQQWVSWRWRQARLLRLGMAPSSWHRP
jgi:hypothetical protein